MPIVTVYVHEVFDVKILTEWSAAASESLTPLAPITLVTVKGHISKQHWNDYLDYFENFIYEACGCDKTYVVWDLRNAEMVPLTYFHEKAKLLQRIKPKTVRHLVASSIIINSKVIREAVQFVLRFYNNHRPVSFVNLPEESITFFESLSVDQNSEEEAAGTSSSIDDPVAESTESSSSGEDSYFSRRVSDFSKTLGTAFSGYN